MCLDFCVRLKMLQLTKCFRVLFLIWIKWKRQVNVKSMVRSKKTKTKYLRHQIWRDGVIHKLCLVPLLAEVTR